MKLSEAIREIISHSKSQSEVVRAGRVLVQEVNRLTAENARLREALERAAVNLEVAGFYDSAKSARQALKEGM